MNEVLAILKASKFLTDSASPEELERALYNEATWISQFATDKIAAAKRRADGEPLQYVLGSQAFLDHDFYVGPGVLIPRPETEGLVLSALENLKIDSNMRAGLEIGVGSGAISVSIMNEMSQWRRGFSMVATELSPVAMETALKNADRLLTLEARQAFQVVKITDPDDVLISAAAYACVLNRKFDFIISNPPYLAESDPISEDVRQHEPHEALFPKNPDPLHFYRQIAAHAHHVLNPNGKIFLEIPHHRSAEIEKLFRDKPYNVEIGKDLAGHDRILTVWTK